MSKYFLDGDRLASKNELDYRKRLCPLSSRPAEFAMKWHTEYYPPGPPEPLADPRIGLPDLRKGLNTILLGYLLSFGAILILGGVIGYLIAQAGNKPASAKAAEQASTVVFTAALLLGLAGLVSLLFIVRGKWMCLMSAPEQFYAKWLMFLSITCILAGPTLSFGVFLVGDGKADSRTAVSDKPSASFLGEFQKYKHGMPSLDTHGYIKLAGQVVSLFSSIFFVLFLRAVALCLGVQERMRRRVVSGACWHPRGRRYRSAFEALLHVGLSATPGRPRRRLVDRGTVVHWPDSEYGRRYHPCLGGTTSE